MSACLVIIDARVPVGMYEVGGVVLLSEVSDADLGYALRARPIRVHDEAMAVEVERHLDAKGTEHRRLDADRGRFVG